MKKIIRILGVTLSLLVLTSCSKDDEPDNNLPVVTPSSLVGSYKVTFATVNNLQLDTNKDGYFTSDLLVDGYNACTFDNTIEITPTTYAIIKKGVSCAADEKNEIYEYKLDEKLKTIELIQNGKVLETLKQVYLLEENGTKKIQYEIFDTVLDRTVYIDLTKI